MKLSCQTDKPVVVCLVRLGSFEFGIHHPIGDVCVGWIESGLMIFLLNGGKWMGVGYGY